MFETLRRLTDENDYISPTQTAVRMSSGLEVHDSIEPIYEVNASIVGKRDYIEGELFSDLTEFLETLRERREVEGYTRDPPIRLNLRDRLKNYGIIETF